MPSGRLSSMLEGVKGKAKGKEEKRPTEDQVNLRMYVDRRMRKLNPDPITIAEPEGREKGIWLPLGTNSVRFPGKLREADGSQMEIPSMNITILVLGSAEPNEKSASKEVDTQREPGSSRSTSNLESHRKDLRPGWLRPVVERDGEESIFPDFLPVIPHDERGKNSTIVHLSLVSGLKGIPDGLYFDEELDRINQTFLSEALSTNFPSLERKKANPVSLETTSIISQVIGAPLSTTRPEVGGQILNNRKEKGEKKEEHGKEILKEKEISRESGGVEETTTEEGERSSPSWPRKTKQEKGVTLPPIIPFLEGSYLFQLPEMINPFLMKTNGLDEKGSTDLQPPLIPPYPVEFEDVQSLLTTFRSPFLSMIGPYNMKHGFHVWKTGPTGETQSKAVRGGSSNDSATPPSRLVLVKGGCSLPPGAYFPEDLNKAYPDFHHHLQSPGEPLGPLQEKLITKINESPDSKSMVFLHGHQFLPDGIYFEEDLAKVLTVK